MNEDCCATCGGPLFVDRRSIAQLAREGFEGARIYCRCGCTDVWLKRPILRAAPPIPSDGRGRYPRELRSYACAGCGVRCETRGNNAHWCTACLKASRAKRERKRYADRKSPRRRVAVA